ncbi:hypothetical protein KAU88_00715 [Candidatus Bathyarchaeota archaeon]|nr:hypothetical protein [Candidatus Bathyarchaeota archaeon]
MMSVQRILEKELARLKRLIPSVEVSVVRWEPKEHYRISGEVVGNTIYVFDLSTDEALDTLRHEFLDCLITRRIVNPLVSLINTLIKTRENEIYREKEQLINLLSKHI